MNLKKSIYISIFSITSLIFSSTAYVQDYELYYDPGSRSYVKRPALPQDRSGFSNQYYRSYSGSDPRDWQGYRSDEYVPSRTGRYHRIYDAQDDWIYEGTPNTRQWERQGNSDERYRQNPSYQTQNRDLDRREREQIEQQRELNRRLELERLERERELEQNEQNRVNRDRSRWFTTQDRVERNEQPPAQSQPRNLYQPRLERQTTQRNQTYTPNSVTPNVNTYREGRDFSLDKGTQGYRTYQPQRNDDRNQESLRQNENPVRQMRQYGKRNPAPRISND